MTRVLDIADPARGEEAGEFQGRLLGASVSVIVVDAPAGGGPRLHRHSYEEVFVVQEGSATFTAGDEVIEATGGQVVVVPAGVAHKFVNSGDARLRQVDIHASDHFVTECLNDRGGAIRTIHPPRPSRLGGHRRQHIGQQEHQHAGYRRIDPVVEPGERALAQSPHGIRQGLVPLDADKTSPVSYSLPETVSFYEFGQLQVVGTHADGAMGPDLLVGVLSDPELKSPLYGSNRLIF